MLSPSKGQVAYALLTRSPLRIYRNKFSVRLACVRHAASVRPEPGSNSPIKFYWRTDWLLLFKEINWLGQACARPAHSLCLGWCSVFKVPPPYLGDLYIIPSPHHYVNTFFHLFLLFLYLFLWYTWYGGFRKCCYDCLCGVINLAKIYSIFCLKLPFWACFFLKKHPKTKKLF